MNPHAGRNRGRDERLPALRKIVGGDGLVEQPESLEALDRFAQLLSTCGADLVAVCGGDGSFFRALSALVRAFGAQTLPAFLPLRAGSMNTIARSVNVRPGSPEQVLRSVVSRYRAGEALRTTERHLIRVNGDFYGFMVGAGVIVNFLQVYYSGARRGPVAAAVCLGRAVASGLVGGRLAHSLLQGFRATVDCDGERVPLSDYNVLYASTIEDIGLGFSATYLATRKRGFFHCLAGRVRARDVIARLPHLRSGCPLRIPTLYDNLAQVVLVEFKQETSYTIDGDLLPEVRQLRCEIGPRLTIVQGD